ncbi:MAG TPA: TonB-dependent receptor [Albitalea sp.]
MKSKSSGTRALRCAAAAAALLASNAAHAQPSAFELDPVTVTASGTPRTLGSEIASTSVVTRADIERAGARDAVSVLRLLGTVQVEQLGGPGTLAAMRIRGADSRDTLVLVDGVPLTDVTSGQALIQQIPADMIERVEVVRGNLSALYGANATGGVIQIFTRRAAAGAPTASVEAALGSRQTRALNASVGGGTGPLRARLGVGAERTDGFSAADPAIATTANPDRDSNKRRHATLALDAEPVPGHRLALDARHVDGKVEYDDTSAFATPADTHRQHLVQKGATLRGEHALAADWSLGWRWGRSDERRTDTGATAFGPFEFGGDVHNRLAAIDVDGALAPGWRTKLGVERLEQSTDAPTYLRNRRDTDVVRAGTTFDAAWGALQANVRHDRTSDFGDANTGLVGATLNLGSGLAAVASVASSFTPPTLDFLFFDCSPFPACSNPDLRPEKSRNVEAGLQWQDAQTWLRATVFHVRTTDKIATDENFFPRNLARTRNRGVELAARVVRGAWRLAGEATLHDPEDAANGAQLQRRARQQVTLRADHETARWGAGAGLRYVSDRPDRLAGVDVRVPGYAVADASARWRASPGLSLQATVENLFDRRYQPAAGYSGRPRGLFVSALWQLAP